MMRLPPSTHSAPLDPRLCRLTTRTIATTRWRGAGVTAPSSSPTCTWARRAARLTALLDFLKAHPSDYLYLVGDIVDGWQLRRSWYWPQSHNDVVQKLLRTRAQGLPRDLRAGQPRRVCAPVHRPPVRRHRGAGRGRARHRRRPQLWVMHGDYFDGVIQCAKWLAYVGDNLYEFTLKLNRHLNRLRARLGLPYWSLSAYLKHKVKKALNYVTDFEVAVASEARRRGHQGVVCGHIHRAEMRDIDGTLYCNDGDWVESRTALVEHFDGRLELRALGAFARNRGSGHDRHDKPRAVRPHENRPGHRCLAAAGQWRGHHAGGTGARAATLGHQVEVIHPGLFKTRPCPGLCGHRPGDRARSACSAPELDAPAARRHPHGDRRPAGLGGARLLPASGACLHHGLPHQVPGNPQRRLAECRCPGVTRCSAISTSPRPA